MRALDPDFLLCSAYKFYGPHVGILYSKPGALERLPTSRLSVQDPAPPYRIETGTLNHAAIEGVRAAIEYLASWGTGASLRERIVDAMTVASPPTSTGSRAPITRGCGASAASRSGDPTSARARARRRYRSRSSGTAPAAAAAALGEQGICVWDGNFYAARAVEVLGLAERGGLLRTGDPMYSSAAEIAACWTPSSASADGARLGAQ